MLLPLSDLCEIRTGYQFRKGVGDEVADAEPVGVIQLRDVENGAAKLDGLERARIKSADKYLVQSGDVLFLARGQRFVATPLEDVPRGVIAVHLFVILRPREAGLIAPEFLAWSLNHPRTQAGFKGLARHSHIPFLSASEVRKHALEVPPLELQLQIVALDRARQREDELARLLLQRRTRLVDELTWQLAARPG